MIEMPTQERIRIQTALVRGAPDLPVISYQDACRLRAFAERYADAEMYSMAADYFSALDMEVSADRCRERANYYRTQEQ